MTFSSDPVVAMTQEELRVEHFREKIHLSGEEIESAPLDSDKQNFSLINIDDQAFVDDKIQFIPESRYSVTKVPDSEDAIDPLAYQDRHLSYLKQEQLGNFANLRASSSAWLLAARNAANISSIAEMDEDQSRPSFVFGPKSYKILQNLDMIKPTQLEADESLEAELDYNLESSQGMQVELQKLTTEQIPRSELPSAFKTELASMEGEVKYLQSLLSKEYDSEKLLLISDILTKNLVRTTRLSSAGKTSLSNAGISGKLSGQSPVTLRKASNNIVQDSDQGNSY